jgi:GGDEF domain-containing protein
MSNYHDNIKLFTDLMKADRKLFPALKHPDDVKPKLDKITDKHMFLDSMVGNVGNRFAYHNLIQRYGNQGVHIAINANSFNDINSQFGNKAGDSAIQELFSVISAVAGKHAMPVFRVRGDEARLLADDEDSAQAFANELFQALEQKNKVQGQHKLTVAVGMGFNPQLADESLSYAKHQLSHRNESGMVERLAKPGNEVNTIHSSLNQGAPPDWRPLMKQSIDFGYTFDDTLASSGLEFNKPL